VKIQHGTLALQKKKWRVNSMKLDAQNYTLAINSGTIENERQ
jgi:hypothetical protein